MALNCLQLIFDECVIFGELILDTLSINPRNILKNLVRFAHNWNVGMLEYWNNGLWETGKVGYCDNSVTSQKVRVTSENR